MELYRTDAFGSFFILVLLAYLSPFHRHRYRRFDAADVPSDIAVITVSQTHGNGLDNFALLAIPFFIFAGT